MTEIKRSKFGLDIEKLSGEVGAYSLSFDCATNQPGEKHGKIAACELIMAKANKINLLAQKQLITETKKSTKR